MTTIDERYELQCSEGHPCTTDIGIRIQHGRTLIQESFSLVGPDTLAEAELCCALYLAGYAIELARAAREGLTVAKRVRLIQDGGERHGDVELDVHCPQLRRTVQVAVAGCAGVDEAEQQARATLVALAEAVRTAVMPRLAVAGSRAAAVGRLPSLPAMVQQGLHVLQQGQPA